MNKGVINMILIIAVDKNFSIGYKGDMLFHLKTDLKRFKEITSGHIMVMGRKTLESLPGGKPLPNRTHIVITSDKNYKNEDAIVLNNINDLDSLLKEINTDNRDVFLIGGGNLVDQLIDKCDKAYITLVNKEYTQFDTAIPNLEKLDNWELVGQSDLKTETQGDEKFEFVYNIYKNLDHHDMTCVEGIKN